MADEILKRDENYVTVGAGVSNDVDQDILMLRVDPVTGYLLADITEVGATSATESQIARRDGNHVPVCLAWNEEANELQEILTDASGNLLCDITFV